MKPHDLSPHAVFTTDPPPWRDSCFPPKPGGQHFYGTTLAEFLVEPNPRSTRWLSSLYARLVVASSGPVLLGPITDNLGVARLERARWLRIAPDADAQAARQAAWPALEAVRALGIGVGSLAPDLVVVAERDPYGRLPMFARSGVWLFQALRRLGFDELTVYVTNALDPDGHGQAHKLTQLRDAFGAYGPQWLTLGSIAHEALTGAGIEHVAADHPSHARRFEFQAGPEGYAQKLLDAGLQRGTAGELYVVNGTNLLYGTLGLPDSPSLRPTSEGSRRRAVVSSVVLDKAHTAFLMGECATIKEAARFATSNKTERAAIIRLAREQGWEVERDRFLADKREKAKATASDEEAKRIGKARSLAWEATELMLTKIVTDLRSGDVKVYAKDAKAINEVALALSEKGDAKFDEEKKRLESLSPDAFAAEIRKTLGHFGVTGEQKQEAPPQA